MRQIYRTDYSKRQGLPPFSAWRCGLKWSVLLSAVCAAGTSHAWTAEPAKDPLTSQERCLLRSETQKIQDGYGETPVTLVFNGEVLSVVTASEIDPNFSDLELVIDNNMPAKTSRVARKKIVVFDNEIPALIEQFKAGYWATVYLRFWPTWPATQLIPVKFDLRGFTKAYSDFERCRQGPNQTGFTTDRMSEKWLIDSSIDILPILLTTWGRYEITSKI